MKVSSKKLVLGGSPRHKCSVDTSLPFLSLLFQSKNYVDPSALRLYTTHRNKRISSFRTKLSQGKRFRFLGFGIITACLPFLIRDSGYPHAYTYLWNVCMYLLVKIIYLPLVMRLGPEFRPIHLCIGVMTLKAHFQSESGECSVNREILCNAQLVSLKFVPRTFKSEVSFYIHIPAGRC